MVKHFISSSLLITCLLLTSIVHGASIDAVFFAQTHVQQSNAPYFIGLVGDREALIKAHIISPQQVISPGVQARLTLNGQVLTLPMNGPNSLPASIEKDPGKVRHAFSNSFTAYIPKEWVKPGLRLSIITPSDRLDFNSIRVGAPTQVLLTMFDIHYFQYSQGDYTNGWQSELESKWPVADLALRRIPNIVFNELVIPARAGAPAVRVDSKQSYFDQTGLGFDGEQGAAAQWNGALKRAAGTRGRISLYYTNIYGVAAGGQAGGFGGVGNGTSAGILHHELGHALSLPHWGRNGNYPYKGDMFGIKAPAIFNDTHAGPTWAFDLRSRRFIPSTVQANAVRGNSVVGTYKADPMQGGGSGDQESGYIFRHFSDYSVRQMRNYLEGHVLTWNPSLNSYAAWNQAAGGYTNKVTNNGVSYPIERDVDVISVMASISASSLDVNMIYPPIGPYTAGVVELFEPSNSAHRQTADDVFCPKDGCDLSLRLFQGGKRKTYMLASSWNPSLSPTDSSALSTQAINLRASNGAVKHIELLLTPNAEKNGLPIKPVVLAEWGQKPIITPIYLLLDE